MNNISEFFGRKCIFLMNKKKTAVFSKLIHEKTVIDRDFCASNQPPLFFDYEQFKKKNNTVSAMITKIDFFLGLKIPFFCRYN